MHSSCCRRLDTVLHQLTGMQIQPFFELTSDAVLDALNSTGLCSYGYLLTLISNEN
jgi:hypothetical protein